MSGIGYEHNKFESCDGCPDRTIEPNCHDTCRGNLYRVAEREKERKERRKDFDYYSYRKEAIQKMGKKIGEK